VRGGAIIPEQPVVQSTAEIPNGPLEIRVYPGPNCSGSIYADDGHTFDYKHGHYFRQEFTCEASDSGVTVNLAKPEGDFTPWWKTMRVVVYGPTKTETKELPFSQAASTLTFSN
jgi:alpha-glucosidase